jgi:hypothetical protein
MPYLEIQLDGRSVACAGADDLDVLQTNIIATPSGEVSMESFGIRFTDSASSEHAQWVSQRLSPGDLIDITLMSSARPTVATSTLSPPIDLEKIKRDLNELKEGFRRRYPDGALSLPRVTQPVTLLVSTTNTPCIVAALGDEEQLQVVLTWTKEGCVLAVDAISVLKGGNTTGKQWLEERISPGQLVQVMYPA